MEFDIEALYESLDFSAYDYFYHQTDLGNGDSILERGLLVKGNNILNTSNILFTTASPFIRSDIKSLDSFLAFLEESKSLLLFRNTFEMIIIAIPKGSSQYIVERCNIRFKGEVYPGIIPTECILGYINLEDNTFIANDNFDYFYSSNPKKLLY